MHAYNPEMNIHITFNNHNTTCVSAKYDDTLRDSTRDEIKVVNLVIRKPHSYTALQLHTVCTISDAQAEYPLLVWVPLE